MERGEKITLLAGQFFSSSLFGVQGGRGMRRGRANKVFFSPQKRGRGEHPISILIAHDLPSKIVVRLRKKKGILQTWQIFVNATNSQIASSSLPYCPASSNSESSANFFPFPVAKCQTFFLSFFASMFALLLLLLFLLGLRDWLRPPRYCALKNQIFFFKNTTFCL